MKFWFYCVDGGTVHIHKAAYPAGNPLCILHGIPYTPTQRYAALSLFK